jgi:probable DNA metabolism protein
VIHVKVGREFESFRAHARALVAAHIAPAEVLWSDLYTEQNLLLTAEPPPIRTGPSLNVPKRYFDLAKLVFAHSDPERWNLLYSVLWRIQHGERHLLSLQIDPAVMRLEKMRGEIARDVHHMHAFVRFRRVLRGADEWFVAWYKPDHHVLRLAAPFFEARFAAMRWAILTPDESTHWDGKRLHYAPGVAEPDLSTNDSLETLWSTYYGTTFNPARMNLDLMRQEMPSRFWSQMPELRSLGTVVSEAPARLEKMRALQATSAQSVVPSTSDLRVLRVAASACTACSLHCDATQTVFGEGPADARVVLIGEQPGDVEDLRGRPFVGPAGEVLNRALAAAGIPREQVYVTNAVKHFKFTREGKHRLHQTPRMAEAVACKPWLEAELKALQPEAIVLLGATAAKSLLGSTVRITRDAGKLIATRYAPNTIVTVHPSFVLRSGDREQSEAIYQQLVAHLGILKAVLSPAVRSFSG